MSGAETDGWWVLNSIEVRCPQGNSDIDLLVGIPNFGLLIIEVKGWTSFEVDDRGNWSYPGRGGARMDAGEGPYKQAQRQEYLLLEYLSALRSSGLIHRGDLPKIGSRVLLGNLDSTAAGLTGVKLLETLFRDTFCPANPDAVDTGGALLNRLQQALRMRAKPGRPMENSKDRLDEIREVLSPLCSVNGLASFLESSQIRLDELSETALGERAAGYEGSRLYVEGAAGTGKTCFGLKLAVERSRDSGRTALFVCFSKRLAEDVRNAPWVGRENVRVGTPEDLLEQLGHQERLLDFLRQEAESASARQRSFELLGISSSGDLPRSYLESSAFCDALAGAFIESDSDFSAIVVDEAQDLPELLLQTLHDMAGPTDLFAIFADPRQTTRRERSGLPWTKPRFMDLADFQRLRRNYRNGDRIIDRVENEFDIQYGRPPRGAPPAEVIALEYGSSSELVNCVKVAVESLSSDGVQATVLISGVQETERDQLRLLGIETFHVDEFKGLERRCVVLVLGPDANPLDPNREELYVGLTRAMTHLTIVRPSR